MDKEIILDKLAYLKQLIEKLDLRIEKYEKEKENIEKETLFLAISKLCEEIIETSIKINNIFLEKNKDYGPTYYETFIRLGKYYKIDSNLLKKLAKTTSIKNKITPDYENIFLNQKLELILEISNLFPKYIEIIKKIIKND